MRLFNHIKAGAWVAPAFSIVLYYLFTILDIFTTYLVTPDLKLETNWIILYFGFNWSQFIIFYSCIVLLTSSFFLIALNILYKFYQENVHNNRAFIIEAFHNIRLFISFILLGCFYSHFINLFLVTINNYLCYISFFRIKNALSNLSSFYVYNQSIFHNYIQIMPIIIGYVVAVFKVISIRKKCRTISI